MRIYGLQRPISLRFCGVNVVWMWCENCAVAKPHHRIATLAYPLSAAGMTTPSLVFLGFRLALRFPFGLWGRRLLTRLAAIFRFLLRLPFCRFASRRHQELVKMLFGKQLHTPEQFFKVLFLFLALMTFYQTTNWGKNVQTLAQRRLTCAFLGLGKLLVKPEFSKLTGTPQKWTVLRMQLCVRHNSILILFILIFVIVLQNIEP